jgi:hypothetical protein
VSFESMLPGKHKRTTKMIINFSNNEDLDSKGYTPFAYIKWGMTSVDLIFKDSRADEARVATDGERYLSAEFPHLTGIRTARVINSIQEVFAQVAN